MSSDGRPGGEGMNWVDPERRQPANAFDAAEGHAGQGYTQARERAEGARHPGGEVNGSDSAVPDNADPAANIPPDNGRRASFDPRTGEVRGSGAGAGGGNPGEDFDSDSASGDGYPLTGSEAEGSDGGARAARDPGPARFNQ